MFNRAHHDVCVCIVCARVRRRVATLTDEHAHAFTMREQCFLRRNARTQSDPILCGTLCTRANPIGIFNCCVIGNPARHGESVRV